MYQLGVNSLSGVKGHFEKGLLRVILLTMLPRKTLQTVWRRLSRWNTQQQLIEPSSNLLVGQRKRQSLTRYSLPTLVALFY